MEGQRKYTFAWAVLVLAFVALFCGKLEGRYFSELLIGIGGVYMAGNVGEHWSKAWKEKKAGSEDATNEDWS